MSNEKAALISQLVELAHAHSGSEALPSSLVTADLGLEGWDYIDFIEHVERKFEVDLTGVSPKSARADARECSIEQLADIIIAQSS